MGSFQEFLEDNIWVPIVAGIAILLLLVIAIWTCCSWKRRRGYQRIGNAVGNQLHMEKYNRQTAHNEAASMNCQYYLRAHPNYSLWQHLPQIGSRVGKSWFAIRKTGDQDQIMSLVTKSSRCVFPFTSVAKRHVSSLIAALQHPYLLPITEMDFLQQQSVLLLMEPLSAKGSLRDEIYKTNPIHEYTSKYAGKGGRGLPVRRIAMIGRQIIEALEFLYARGLKYQHLHTGNIIMDNGVPKLAGYTNWLFGYQSRIYPVLKKLSGKSADLFDVVCFGHVLLEMTMGQPETELKPDMNRLTASCPSDMVEILAFIFYHPENRIPSLAEVKSHPVFARIAVSDMPELTAFSRAQIPLSSGAKQIIKAVSQGKQLKSSVRRSSSETSFSFSSTNTSLTRAPSINSSAPTTPARASSAAPSAPPTAPATPAAAAAPAPPPPPPPAPGPPPPPPAAPAPANLPPPQDGRNALLDSIRGGKSLKKTGNR
eukprot:m.36004 g.36004  ORF g.36004 m.36004 type:complete len:482 (-) comp12438_c0_seq1:176-1621(-)